MNLIKTVKRWVAGDDKLFDIYTCTVDEVEQFTSDSGRDCTCCGDRWSRLWHDETGDETPLIHGGDPVKVSDLFTKQGEPLCHIYYLDGTKKTHIK